MDIDNQPLSYASSLKYPRKSYLWYDFKKEDEFEANLILCSYGWEDYYKKEWPVEIFIKEQPEKFTKLDFLYFTNTFKLVVHKRVLDVLNKVCPHDFKPVRLKIVNPKGKIQYFCNKKVEPDFVNTDYYALAILYELDLLDREKSEWKPDNRYSLKEIWWKEDPPWKEHLLCRDTSTPGTFFHPRLAAEFKKNDGKEIQFQVPNHD